ncbi:MAG TPA: hypothetical protein V6D50_24060 [Chroococcales cyanobacterium]|jgi:hypothetical protein
MPYSQKEPAKIVAEYRRQTIRQLLFTVAWFIPSLTIIWSDRIDFEQKKPFLLTGLLLLAVASFFNNRCPNCGWFLVFSWERNSRECPNCHVSLRNPRH